MKTQFRIDYDDSLDGVVSTIAGKLEDFGITIEWVEGERDGFELYDIEMSDAITANGIEKMQKMKEAMQEFCERCEKGEVKSTYTYNKFKALING